MNQQTQLIDKFRRLSVQAAPTPAVTSAHFTMSICRRCHQEYDSRDAAQVHGCRFHPDMFVCRPHPADHYAFELNDDKYAALLEHNWPAKFWDCCGAETHDAPGCVVGHHLSFDE
ncbi:hypothetical protein AMAG_04217 [Allomyces macrogynus ATCC 38327]|uniref:Uncharacterized protein n=2 Tax=Allomyces macrogynus (strain ATCC 38327) TaxID=578462 RepID=A0A0L0S8C8_ALLM3|nr:hypothetical protein AMAG_04217 [Allomyces macrogynus ATCC 38327]|eukprot:KNE58660.1 hypothetical protein AMAG_04217 [Allomyces macrogynus ATCC 38327]